MGNDSYLDGSGAWVSVYPGPAPMGDPGEVDGRMVRRTDEISEIWSPEYLVRLEREIWIQVMEVHLDHGLLEIRQLAQSKQWAHWVDLERIRGIEMVTKHDLKARLEEFCQLSQHQRIHMGMTSADIVENSYLIRIWRSIVALDIADQVTRPPFRGIRGPVGSDQDQLELLGSAEAVDELNVRIATAFGFDEVINAVAQIMPRSIDAGMATQILGALPNKTPWWPVLSGYVAMLCNQEAWLEGDVSTSVIRRVAWPNLLHTAALVLDTNEEESNVTE